MRFFNTAGPVKSDLHYCLPPLQRLNPDAVLSLIAQQKYFALHAPRQTGKTTSLLALMDYLNQEGAYRCLYVNVEMAQTARGDVNRGMQTILGRLASQARTFLQDNFLDDIWFDVWQKYGGDGALNETLSQWAQTSAKPLILLIDEIDALVGDTLISVLRQLRDGYARRPAMFPQSIVLCGVRDVRDYRIHSDKEKAVITGGSAFNIKATSLRLGDFGCKDVATLYRQHTEETGQTFTPDALELAWELSQGQPWLVNALAYETCFEIESSRNRSLPITPDLISEAKERIILRRETHLDQLVDKLKEPRVQCVMTPILEGGELERAIKQDDLDYVSDLGLVSRTKTGLQIANPVYREIIPRELSYIFQLNFEPIQQPAWYVAQDGRLDVIQLLHAFQEFFRENSEHWMERFNYKEAGPQLLMQAFLQRIVNGGGRVEREYGLGRKRTDLLLLWPYEEAVQKAAIELKILHKSLKRTIEEGLEQTWEFMDRCGTSDGHLIIFDRSETRSWEEKNFRREESYNGHPITVWGM